MTRDARKPGAESTSKASLIDTSEQPLEVPTPWAPIKVSAAVIDAEIDRLSAMPRPASGRRTSLIVHPQSTSPGLGFAPGIDVSLEVLNPGESTSLVRRNASQVCVGIRGTGTVCVGDRTINLAKWDVCNVPSMQDYTYRNDAAEVWVRLTYSNAPLLAKLEAGYAESRAGRKPAPQRPAPEADAYTRQTAPDIQVSPLGSRLRGYEYLVDIEVVESNAHHWPWQQVSEHLSAELGDGKRTIMALYNPATERRNGATHSFFVTAAQMPAGLPPRPAGLRGHRHNSVAINYHFSGSGSSIVNGEVIEWSAGDLLLSAPGWLEHAHSPGPDGLGVFTVQDHPLHIGMESLIWQEDMEGPILTLGAEPGLTGYIGPRETGS